MLDQYGREIDYVRISVTDRCNLRCIYCMPEDGVELISCDDILSYEEIIKACHAFGRLGIKKIKITGGEPLVRLDICHLIARIKQIEGIEQVTITTNGVLLSEKAHELITAGVDSINISLDTIDRSNFKQLTRCDQLAAVMAGIETLIKLNYPHMKINCVPIDEFNGAQIVDIARLAKDHPIAVRFIELMPIGLASDYKPIPRQTILAQLQANFGELTPWPGKLGNGPAVYYSLPNFTGKIGFIEAMNNKFCHSCNRIRLTSTGFLKLCLHYNKGVDIGHILRQSEDLEAITAVIAQAIFQKPKEHQFNETVLMADLIDERKMFQVGG